MKNFAAMNNNNNHISKSEILEIQEAKKAILLGKLNKVQNLRLKRRQLAALITKQKSKLATLDKQK